jgi:hypothetical protein
MKYYINYRGEQGLETIDTASTRKEAACLMMDYNDAFGGQYCHVSKRATKDWYKSNR